MILLAAGAIAYFNCLPYTGTIILSMIYIHVYVCVCVCVCVCEYVYVYVMLY